MEASETCSVLLAAATGATADTAMANAEVHPTANGGAVAEQQPTVVEKQPAAAEDELAVRRGSRRRHRIRRRGNGALRSCVLQSGRWINLPRARRAANDTTTAVQVRKQQHEQQRQCRFNVSGSGCRRSQCKYAPAGHAPAIDGPKMDQMF